MELPHPRRSARSAGLRYVSDAQPGIRRQRRGRSFRYVRADGRPLRRASELSRINALAIPPAWENVWICCNANGHLQATGSDARGRKQYRYHPQWSALRNKSKFTTMADFGRWLPAIRRRVARDLRRPGLPRDKVIACVVWLLDEARIRVGNNEYARDNKSFGLTTIRNHHAHVRGATVRFSFNGKSGRKSETEVIDPRVAKIIRHCQELPGQELFAYVDARGHSHDIDSGHINDYLRRITGMGFTAKDFRTWSGTVIAASALEASGKPSADGNGTPLSKRELKRREVAAVRAAAEALGNTLATCRKFYVHPRLIDAYADGLLHACFTHARRTHKPARLSVAERAVLRLVKSV